MSATQRTFERPLNHVDVTNTKYVQQSHVLLSRKQEVRVAQTVNQMHCTERNSRLGGKMPKYLSQLPVLTHILYV